MIEKPEIVRRRTYNRLCRAFRSYVETLYEVHKNRPEYKFVNYAVYLIWYDLFVVDYIINSIIDSESDDNLLGDEAQFELAVKVFNIGKNTNLSNRADGIDAIDSDILIRSFDLILKPFEEELLGRYKKDVENLKGLRNYTGA